MQKLRGFSPQTNYIDRVTVASRRSWCQLLRIDGVAWSAQRIPTAVNLGFLDPELLKYYIHRFQNIYETLVSLLDSFLKSFYKYFLRIAGFLELVHRLVSPPK
jgi:hypothetical protein